MTETQTVPGLRVSARSEIQNSIDQKTQSIKERYPEAPDSLINELLRSRKAAELRVQRLKSEVEKEHGESITDPLTGALNRNGFDSILQLEGRRTTRTNSPMVIVVLDANNLKELNDSEGHKAGDEYLKKIATVLQKTSRASDILARQPNSPTPEEEAHIARWGGDEFGVILDGTDFEGAKAWWERTAAEFALAGISIKAGMQILNPEDIKGKTPGEMSAIISQKKNEADQAMYFSKPISKSANTAVLTSFNEIPEKTAGLNLVV